MILDPCFGPPRTVEVGDTRLHVYGIAYDAAIEPDPLPGFVRSADDGLHVVLLHAGILDNPDWGGGHGLRTSAASIQGIDADYVALGDYHGSRLPGDIPGGRSAYSGSLAAVRLGETGVRGALVVELDPDRLPAGHLESSSAPQLVEVDPIDVSDARADLEAADRIGSVIDRTSIPGGSYPVVRIVGEPPYPLDPDRITDALVARFGFAVVKDETRFIDSTRLQALASEPSIVGHVVRLGLQRLENEQTDADRLVAERALRIALRALEGV